MVVQELIAKLGFDVDQGGMRKVDNGLSSLIKQVGLLAAAWKAVGLVIDSVKGAANLESMNAEFEVMLGNADAARYLVQQIQGMAAATPFETAGLIANVRMMMAFGQTANQAMSALKFLGDVAGGSQEKLDRLTLAYSQVMAAGKLQGQDLLQFVNAGFNPLQVLSEKTGKSMAQLRKDMEKGAISADMVRQAFETVTGPGGRFFGNMEKQSQTLNGLWSTMIDNIKILMAELGGRLVPFVKQVIIGIIGLSDAIAGAYRQLGDFFGLMMSDGPTAEDTANGIATAFMTIADAIMAVFTVFQGFKVILDGLMGVVFGFLGLLTALATSILVIPLRILAWIEDKLAMLLAKVGVFKSLIPELAADAKDARNASDVIATPANILGDMAAQSFAAAGAGSSKLGALFSMIGGSKDAAPGTKQGLTPAILAALAGKGTVVNNNVNTDITIHADGSIKDILREQANDIIGTTILATRLKAAAV
mgnify:CR=1 FL=1